MSAEAGPWWRNRWLTLGVRIALGGIFVAAAIPKIADPPSFAHMIYNYRLLPGAAINVLALALPWLELITGVLLVFGVWRRAAAGIAGILLIVFLAALSTNLARGNPVNCGCFDVHATGKSRPQLLAEMRWTILRDVGLLILAAQAFAASRNGGERDAAARF